MKMFVKGTSWQKKVFAKNSAQMSVCGA